MKLGNREIAALGALAIAGLALFSSGVFVKDRGRPVDPAVTGQAVTLSNQQIKNKANSIYNTINGSASGLLGGLYTALSDLNALNDADFVAVANQYAATYASSAYPTLYGLINDEYTYPFTDTRAEKTKVLERLKKFGLA